MEAAKLRTEDVTFSDRISHLPDDLLFRMLSLVPISDAMHTNLLSKRWKSVWKMMPTLEYDQSCCANIGSLGFEEFCKRSVQLHEAPVLRTLTLKLNQQRSLKLPGSFPDTVFQKLVVLKLHTIIPHFPDSPPSTVCFQSLKSLHLTHVSFLGEKGFCRLISACPVLDDLFLDSVTSRIQVWLRSSFTISVPSLQRLEIKQNTSHDPIYPSYHSEFKIDTPSLKYIRIIHSIGSFIFYEDMPNLVEARLGVAPYQTDKFLRFLTSVQFLSICIYAKEVLLLAKKISQRLLHLELHIYGKSSLNLLLYLLKQSPKLQFLKLHETHKIFTMPTYPSRLIRSEEYNDPSPSVCNPSSIPEFVSFHLKAFQWLLYRGREEEKQIVLYILQNALCLKTAAISLSSVGLQRGEELLMIKELEYMPKVSTSCKLVVQHRE
ncbi:putative F-box/FBD/LRR-repeat protein At5g56810 [Raphanus sativus]|uniref:F-box/FBD/LRR-repeat protein At5g56810 n=1 Tax=Raphanus sativus TaxID=3726 RepID=A0A9W3CFH0_RAPSA|nr:putative F-box/FBD/LRR-repeat protein At5g56810 [Raphanus sativus]